MNVWCLVIVATGYQCWVFFFFLRPVLLRPLSVLPSYNSEIQFLGPPYSVPRGATRYTRRDSRTKDFCIRVCHPEVRDSRQEESFEVYRLGVIDCWSKRPSKRALQTQRTPEQDSLRQQTSNSNSSDTNHVTIPSSGEGEKGSWQIK